MRKQKKSATRYSIYADGEFVFSADEQDIVRYSLKEGISLSEDDINNMKEKCEYTKCYNYALFLLTYRDYTLADLKDKLIKKEYSEKTIDITIEKLNQYKMIDDDRYIKKFVKDATQFKKQGILKIKQGLMSKGIPKSELDKIEIDNDQQIETCTNLAEKKYRQLEGSQNIKQKLYRYLANKGYTFDVINTVVNRIIKGDNFD